MKFRRSCLAEQIHYNPGHPLQDDQTPLGEANPAGCLTHVLKIRDNLDEQLSPPDFVRQIHALPHCLSRVFSAKCDPRDDESSQCDIDLFGDIAICATGGDKVVSRSTICIGLSPADGSSFELFLAQSHRTFCPPSRSCFLAR